MRLQITQARTKKDLYRLAYSYERRVKSMERQLKTLKDLLEHDDLTGLWNRNAFELAFKESIESNQRSNQPFALLVMDLNHFGSLNKKHGHLHGNEKLKEFAEHLQFNVRDTDIVSRFGGDEFCVLLRNVSIIDVVSIGKRMMHGAPNGFSAGVLWCHAGIDLALPEELFEIADGVLRKIKSERNHLKEGTFGCFCKTSKQGIEFGIYA